MEPQSTYPPTTAISASAGRTLKETAFYVAFFHNAVLYLFFVYIYTGGGGIGLHASKPEWLLKWKS